MYLMIVHYLLLCFSLHACSAARPLHQVQGIGGSLQFSSAAKETRPAIMDEYSRVKGNFITTTTLASYSCVENKMKEKISEEIDGRNEKINKVSGKNVALPPATRVMHDMIKIEEKGRQVRILKSEDDNAEESIGGEENDGMGGEDIDVMDYAQPHRKPPIHNNRKP